MSRATLLTVVTLLSAGTLAACSGFRLHSNTVSSRGGLGAPGRPAGGADGGDITGRGLPAGAPAAVAGRGSSGVRRVCRTGARPRGWIAVAYVSSGEGDCPALVKSDSSVTVAVLAYYADRAVDAVLDVCADEPVPRGWAVEDSAADGSDSCPGVTRNGSSTYRIRRVR